MLSHRCCGGRGEGLAAAWPPALEAPVGHPWHRQLTGWRFAYAHGRRAWTDSEAQPTIIVAAPERPVLPPAAIRRPRVSDSCQSDAGDPVWKTAEQRVRSVAGGRPTHGHGSFAVIEPPSLQWRSATDNVLYQSLPRWLMRTDLTETMLAFAKECSTREQVASDSTGKALERFGFSWMLGTAIPMPTGEIVVFTLRVRSLRPAPWHRRHQALREPDGLRQRTLRSSRFSSHCRGSS